MGNIFSGNHIRANYGQALATSAIISIWHVNVSEGNVGHASLKLSDGRTYISWWPKNGAKPGDAPCLGTHMKSLKDDIKAEKDVNPLQYEVAIPDEAKCKRWWKQFKATKNQQYCMTDMNCSKVVYLALKEGGVTFKTEKTIWKPNDIIDNIINETIEYDDGYDTEEEDAILFPFYARIVLMQFLLFLMSTIGFTVWFEHDMPEQFKAGYGMSAFASILLFLGATLFCMDRITGCCIQRYGSYDGEYEDSWIHIYYDGLAAMVVRFLMMFFDIFGGLFYFMGGCGVAYGYNVEHNLSKILTTVHTSVAAIYFAEQAFIGFHAIFIGLIFFRYNHILSNKDQRELICNGLFLFLATIDFFAYGVIGTNASSQNVRTGSQFLATIYFFAIIAVVFNLISFIPTFRETLRKRKFLLVLSGGLTVIMVLIFIAYCVWLHDITQAGFTGSAHFFGVGVFTCVTGLSISWDVYW